MKWSERIYVTPTSTIQWQHSKERKALFWGIYGIWNAELAFNNLRYEMYTEGHTKCLMRNEIDEHTELYFVEINLYYIKISCELFAQ